jgi:hypothetical protein
MTEQQIQETLSLVDGYRALSEHSWPSTLKGARAAIESKLREVAASTVPEPPAYTYASTQATMCAECGKHKHTPLRVDAMGGYVCLTCIDQKLESLLDEATHTQPASEPVPAQKPDPHGCNACTHPQCGRFEGPQKIECRAMADNACARDYATAQPASEPVARADALNTLCKMLHSGEEVEGDDGLAMLVPMDLWNEAQEAIESLVGEDDATTQPAAKQAEPVARDGWVMVPIQATPEMIDAWDVVNRSSFLTFSSKAYAAMLAASPTQPRPKALTDNNALYLMPFQYNLAKDAWLSGFRTAEWSHGITAQEPTE